MKRILLMAAMGLLLINVNGQQTELPGVTKGMGEGRLIGISPAVKDLPANAAMNAVKVRDENGVIWTGGRKPQTPVAPAFGVAEVKADPVLQGNMNAANMNLQASLGANFNGLGYTSVNPPDPTMAAGPNHVIQMINGGSGAYFRIYSKTGAAISAQTYLDNLTGRGGLGDPIVLYDHLADRFVMTEFANSGETGSEGLIMAVSQTADPTGSWYVYYFSTGTTFPDYPKFSVWPDGYYATTNDFANAASYNGSSVYAFDRAKMLAGQPLTSFQTVKFSTTSYTKYFAMSPVLLQGAATPPAGTGGLIAYMFDDSWTSTTADRDSVGLLEYRVNWTNPGLTTLVNLSSLAAATFKSSICTATRGQCIPQPGTTSRLEALHQRVMNQPIYRNFGSRQGIVFSHVLDKGSSISAIRWYELEKTSGNWGILQQSTYSPDNVFRWMPSVAYDAAGNIGLVYNVSDATSVYPGVRYTGRKSCDPLNTMTYPEAVIIAGTSRNGSTRYGDYNHLVADPDGNSFWMTAQWNGATTWSTRVANFSLDNCTPVSCDAPTGLAASNISADAATISWTAVSGASNYTVDYKTSASGTWITAAAATTSTSVNLTGLVSATLYDWRVRTNCASSSSSFSQAQFTTGTVVETCDAPTALTTSSITTSSATVGWAAVIGAVSYTVDYKTTAASTWTTAAAATTSTSVNLSGLVAGTVYDWRVRTNCSTVSSSFSVAQFTTTAAPCNAPAGLAASSITTSGATVSWSAASGAVSYAVEYKTTAATTWTSAGTAITGTSTALSGLAAATTYDWRVRTNCATQTSAFSSAQFTTAAPPACSDPYEPNNSRAAAAAIPVNTDIRAIISSSSDNDYFKFSNTSATRNIRVTLTNLTRDYDIELFRTGRNQRLARSQNDGTASETINYNTTTVSQYEVRVYGYQGANDPANCYTLRVALSSSAFSANAAEQAAGDLLKLDGGLQAYPNPAKGTLNIAFDASENGKAEIRLTDMQGRTAGSKVVGVQKGINITQWDVRKMAGGMYLLRVQQGSRVLTQKVVIVQ